jgi:glycerate kinase
MRLLIAPDAFRGALRAPQVAAAIGRGVERAGLEPPDLCPIGDGGAGTMETLLLALGGETRAGFGLLDDGGTAVVEVAGASTSRGTGDLIAAAVAAGAAVILVAAGASAMTDGGAGAIEAVRDAGGLRGARVVVLADVRTPQRAPVGCPWAAFDARLEPGAAFVLDAVRFDERARAAFALVTGEGRLDDTTLHGRAVFEAATRARQAGVPAHAIVGQDALDPFGKRIMDLQHVLEATDEPALEAAGERLAELLVAETLPG